LSLAAFMVNAQDYEDPPPFICPEKNGFFPDLEQCDLYYECLDNVPEAKLCPDGLLFEDGNPNDEKCDYPFNVECGTREFVQEPGTDHDPKCYRANGFFNHEDPNVCNAFYNCVYGKPHLLPCSGDLVFDEAQGTCVRIAQVTEFAKVCPINLRKKEIEGFFCPDEVVLGPHGQRLAHPSFPHPTSCQKFLICYGGSDLNELGCMKGQVFDYTTSKCTLAEDGPEDCTCWYECLADSACPQTCRSDCTCPSAEDQ
jgi:hypothetical protein